jgi:hypothetical protein
MADLFNELAPQSGPFDDVVVPQSNEAPVRPLARFRRSQVVAAARVNPLSEDVTRDFAQLQETYLRTAETYGESQDDLAVAEQRRAQRLRGVLDVQREAPTIDPTGELQIGAAMAAEQAINADIEQERKYALEQQAVDNILDLAASGNRTQAETLINLMESGDVMDQLRDNAAKQLILQNEIDRSTFAASNEPWYSHVAGFLLGAIPFQNSMSQSGLVDTEARNWFERLGDQVMAGERRRMEAASLWAMPIEQFRDAIKNDVLPAIEGNSTFLGFTDRSEYLNLLTGLQNTPRAIDNNLWNVVDNAGWVGVGEITGAARVATSLPRMLVGMGARKEATAAFARAAASVAAEGTEEAAQRAGVATLNEVTDGLTPTIARTNPDMVVPLQAGANEGLANGLEVIGGLERLLQTGRFANDIERQAAVDAFKESSQATFGRGIIVDVSEGARTLADDSSVSTLTFTLGKNSSEGWANKAHAARYHNELGFTDSSVIQGEGGQFFVQVTRNMPETGFYSNVLNTKTTNVLSRFLLGAQQRSDEFLARRAQVSENTRNKIVNDWADKLYKEIKIDPQARERVAQLWQYGENQARWYNNVDEVNAIWRRAYNRDISPKEWQAYQGLKNINDVEYAVRNDVRYKELVLKGYESATFSLQGKSFDSLNARIDDTFGRRITVRTFNEATGTYRSKPFTPEEIEKLRADGYVQLHFDEPIKMVDGKEVYSAVVRRDNLVRDNLRRTQLAYRAGGHRIYREKYFVKQARKTVDEDGNEVWQSPSTFMVGTKAQADEWASVMEQARRLGPDASLRQIDEVFQGRPGYPTAEQFKQGLTDGTYSADHSFVGLFDRELPGEYDNLDYGTHAVDPDEEGITSYLKTHGRLYYSQKDTKSLVDWQGAQAPTLDAYESVNRAFTNIASLSSYNDYKLTSIDRWVNSFKDHLDKGSYKAGASPIEIFLDSKPSSGAGRDRISQALLDQRDIIKRNLGWQTPADHAVNEAQRRFFEFTMGSKASGLRHEASRIAQNWWENKNPIQSLRGMAFDLKLGLFNPVQLLLQANSFMAMAAIDIGGASRAVVSNPLLRHYLLRRSTLKDLEAHIAAGFHKAAGFETSDEYIAFMGSAKASGFFSLNESHSLVNAMGPNTALNLTGNKVQDFRQAGRFFFNEGELVNRMTAYRIAWDRAFKKYGRDADPAKQDQIMNEIFGDAEKFAFSMSRSSQAWWQQGLASIPTQFFAYQARMLEMMFGGQLTRAERGRLIVTQGILYGASGIPIASVVSDMMKGAEGDAPDINTLGGVIDRGFMDFFINQTTGADVMAGERLGTGRFLGDTVGDLFGFSKYGETNTMDVLGGATYSITSDLLSSFKPFLKYMTAESGGETGGPLLERDLRDLASNVSTVSNVLKFMMLRNYGEYVTAKGKIQATDVPTENAWFQLLLGAAPSEADEISARMNYFKNKKKTVDEASRVVEQYRTEIVNHPERSEEISAQINAFVRMLDADIRRDVLEGARAPSQSLLDGLDERMEKELAEREAIRRMEQGAANSGQSN